MSKKDFYPDIYPVKVFHIKTMFFLLSTISLAWIWGYLKLCVPHADFSDVTLHKRCPKHILCPKKVQIIKVKIQKLRLRGFQCITVQLTLRKIRLTIQTFIWRNSQSWIGSWRLIAPPFESLQSYFIILENILYEIHISKEFLLEKAIKQTVSMFSTMNTEVVLLKIFLNFRDL